MSESAVWSFDPVAVGQCECAAWAAYYRHEWRAFLTAAVGMVRAGFAMNRRRTIAGAWHVLRANQAWAPYPDNDPAAARAAMRRFYTLVDAAGHIHLDPTKASTLEVSWWDVHRQRQHDAGVTYDAAVNTLNALYSYVYDAPAELTHKAAALRVDAMDLSDSWVEAGCHLEDPVLAEQRRTLVASYTALRDAMERRFAARRSPAEAE